MKWIFNRIFSPPGFAACLVDFLLLLFFFVSRGMCHLCCLCPSLARAANAWLNWSKRYLHRIWFRGIVKVIYAAIFTDLEENFFFLILDKSNVCPGFANFRAGLGISQCLSFCAPIFRIPSFFYKVSNLPFFWSLFLYVFLHLFLFFLSPSFFQALSIYQSFCVVHRDFYS